MSEHITRLAPSPTGALHLGNARTFLINYLLARRRGWRVLMRVEDLEGPRVKPGAAERMLDELHWLGLRWGEPVVRQSARQAAYQAALEVLIARGAAYPCTCGRRDIESASAAPHREDGLTVYPGTCRGRYACAEEATQATGRPTAWRVKVDGEPIGFDDEFIGPVRFHLTDVCGDFVVFKNDRQAAYQLAVVVDDAEAGVTQIVRGDDLLDSAPRQIYLRRLLGLAPEPRYWHLPLVVGPDGRRLAKRHGDTRLGHYRDCGVRPERILGLLGYWSGMLADRAGATMEELLERFDIGRLPRQPVVFSKADETFLRSG